MAKRIPQRMCVSCRSMRPKNQLMRIVQNQSGEIALDPSGKKPGRGAYICRSRACIEQAVKAHRLEKGLKAPVGSDVINQLVREMEAMPVDEATENE
ncbi:MAG: YlxR family protein [Ruminococcaceae bacterium]|nr:YlxR family protein [Oscillospiraceae bacterium]